MCLVSCGGKGDSHDDEQQGRRAEQTSHSVIPRIKSGSGVANAPLGGAFSPGSVERRKNSVIIASPYISSEVPVLPTFTLFSLSPKSTNAASHPCPNPLSLPWNPPVRASHGGISFSGCKPQARKQKPVAPARRTYCLCGNVFLSNDAPVHTSDQAQPGEKSPPRPDRRRAARCLRE